MLTSITFVLLVLKLAGIFQISWFWVLLPMLLEIILVIVATFITLTYGSHK